MHYCNLDPVLLVTPSEARSRNTFVTYPPSIFHVRLSSNSQILWTVPEPRATSPLADHWTFSADPVLLDVIEHVGHGLEGWINGSVKSKHCILSVMDGGRSEVKKDTI